MVGASSGVDEGPALLAGRYQLIERLGEGGMGVVWRSFDLDLEEPVAIKILRDELARDETVRAYFRREVKLARRVTHPHVARVFEFGRDAGRYFLTMEFVHGPTLHQVLADGPLPAEQVHAIAVGLCRGLAAAHTAGVVHGDVKPGNILLDADRGAVVTDFGIARALSEAETRDGVVTGTPQYMAPEQIAGREQTLRSDVYAVGVVLYQALTGKIPWPDGDVDALLRIKTSDAKPDLSALPSGLPRLWRELIAGCLERDPAMRPGDARTLLVHLAALRGSLKVKAAPVQPVQPPPPAAIGPKWIEVVPFVASDDLDGSGAWVTADLRDALAHDRGLRVAAPAGEGGSPALTQVIGSVRPSEDGVVVAVQVVDERAPRVDFEVHQPRTALSNLGAELAAKIAAALRPGQPEPAPRTGDVLPPEAAELYVQAREAALDWRPGDALRLFEAALARAPGHRLLRVGHTTARVMAMAMTGDPSTRELAEARRLVEDTVAAHGDLGQAHLDLAIVLHAIDEPVRCARSLRAALHRAPSLVMAHTMMAEVLMQLGRLPDAERHLDIALALDRRSVQAWSGLAELRARQARPAELAQIVEQELDPRFRAVVRVRWTLGRADPAMLAHIDEQLATDPHRLPPAMVALCRDVVALQRGRGDREALLSRLELAHGAFARSRTRCVFAQVLCELACLLGDPPRARVWLSVADRHNLIDRHWLAASDLLAPLRGEPLFAEVMARVQVRADAVGEAIWG